MSAPVAAGTVGMTVTASPTARRTLLTAPYVVTVDAARRVLEDGALLVRGAVIEAVGFRVELESMAPDAERVRLAGHVILPGFVDGHLHATQTLARGIADDVDEVAVRWGWDRVFPWEAALEDEDVYVSGLLTAVELVRNGVTCFADPGAFHMGAVPTRPRRDEDAVTRPRRVRLSPRAQ